jgi:hypothetical protein
VKTLETMLDSATRAIETKEVMCGSFNEAIYHLNNVHQRAWFSCRQLLERYGAEVERAVTKLNNEKNITIRPEWVLSIMKQETGGAVRPRFEQHLLTRYDRRYPEVDFSELRYRSMSFGLGQILGVNYQKVGAASARAMFVSPLNEQVLFIARFLAPLRSIVSRKNPSEQDFRDVARYYNGPGYAKHHYHERIARWFREFRSIM